MSSAAHRVFNIAELREMIYSHLTDSDLICRLPRICKLWKTYIDCSTDIQRRLFFQPIPGPRLSLAETLTPIPTVPKPAWKDNMAGAEFKGAVIKNPTYERLSSGDVAHKSWTHPTASCRRMLISKPAIISTRAVCQVSPVRVRQVYDEGGIRLGDQRLEHGRYGNFLLTVRGAEWAEGESDLTWEEEAQIRHRIATLRF